MNGVCVVASDKPSMAGKELFLKKGFEIYDTAPPTYQLLVKKMKSAPPPRFTEKAKKANLDDKDGAVFIYSDQCPYIAKFMGEMIEVAKGLGVPVKTLKVTDSAQAQEMPFAYGTCGVFYGGNLLAHGILTQKEFMESLTSAMK